VTLKTKICFLPCTEWFPLQLSIPARYFEFFTPKQFHPSLQLQNSLKDVFIMSAAPRAHHHQAQTARDQERNLSSTIIPWTRTKPVGRQTSSVIGQTDPTLSDAATIFQTLCRAAMASFLSAKT
jgi:hypothetical protein